MMQKTNWDNRFMELAKHIASWSKDPSTQVGAIIVDNKRRIVGTGYNGFPRGVDDCVELYLNKEAKYPRVVHAELNAILNAIKSVESCTLYVHPLPPCSECAKAIIQSGIRKVVCPSVEAESKWWASHKISQIMFEQAGVEVEYV